MPRSPFPPDELALPLPPSLRAAVAPWEVLGARLGADGCPGLILRSPRASLPVRLGLERERLRIEIVGERVPERAGAAFVRALHARLAPQPAVRAWLGSLVELAPAAREASGPFALLAAWPIDPGQPHVAVEPLPDHQPAGLDRPSRAALAIHCFASGAVLEGLSSWESLGPLPDAPTFVELHLELIARASLGQRSQALALCARAETLATSSPEAWLAIARAYEELGEREHALRAHGRILELRGDPLDHLRTARTRGHFQGPEGSNVGLDFAALEPDEMRLAFAREAVKILRGAGRYDELLTLLGAALAALETLDPPADLVLLAARLHLWRGELDQARSMLARAPSLDLAGAEGEHLLLRAITELLAGQVERALATLDAADQHPDTGLERLLWRAEALLIRDDLDAALDCVKAQILRENTLPAYLLKLHILARREDPLDLRRAIGSPSFLDGLVREVLPSLCDADELAAAKAEPERFVALTRKLLDAMAGNRSAEATWCPLIEDQGQDQRGPLRPIERRPSGRDASVDVLVGIRHAQPNEVLAGFEPVAEAYPLSPHPFTYRGELLIWLGRYDDALACFAEGDERSPTRWSFVGRAAAYELLDKSEEAEHWTVTGIERFGELSSATTHVYRGERLRLHGELDAAQRDLEIALDAKPRRIGARINLALVHHARGRAEAWAEQVERLRIDAPAFLFEAGVRADSKVTPKDLLRCLELMVGNRSSFLHTLVDGEGQFRVVPAPSRWIGQARLCLADYRDVLARGLVARWLETERSRPRANKSV